MLSRENHPDLHPDDPDANTRFQSISESYSVLGNEEKRRKYDRDVMGARNRVRGGPGNEGRGGTYAGSRPASGLSKRKGVFRGPPPSYFGRKQASGSSAAGNTSGQGQDQYEGAYGPTSSFAQTGDFDSAGVYKTQTFEDMKRNARRQAAAQQAIQDFESSSDFWVRFVMVTTIVVGGVAISGLIISTFGGVDTRGRKGGMLDGNGSLRKKEPKREKESSAAAG